MQTAFTTGNKQVQNTERTGSASLLCISSVHRHTRAHAHCAPPHIGNHRACQDGLRIWKGEEGGDHSLNSLLLSQFSLQLTPHTTATLSQNCVCVRHDPSARFLSFSKEKIKLVFLKVYFFKRNYVLQSCILLLHLLMFQKVHRPCTLWPVSLVGNITSND